MRPFQALDLLACDDLLQEDERLIRDTVRAFVSDRVLPVIEHHFRAGTFPVDLIPGMAALGMLGANLQGYGCAGLGAVAYGLIMQELERGDSGLRSFVSVQGALAMYPIHAFGSEEQ
jgi:glutaryl-CoA dehydrogenase